MDENNIQQNPSEDFTGTHVPEQSGTIGNVQEHSENVLDSVQKANHTLTVKEVLTMFWNKDVEITERAITKYCHPNRQGVQLLDAYFDENERKFFITPESVPSAIEEVRARKLKMKQNYGGIQNSPEQEQRTGQNVREHSGREESVPEEPVKQTPGEDKEKIKELEEKVFDLSVSNKAKGQIIEHMQEERKETIETMRNDRTFIGKLKTKLLQLGAPENSIVEEENTKSYINVEVAEENPVEGQNEGN